MNQKTELPSVTPEAYLTDGLIEVVEHEELRELCIRFSANHASKTHAEIRSTPLDDEERLALQSVLKFVDWYLPSRQGEYRSAGQNSWVRMTRAAARTVLDHGFIDIEIEDMRQDLRLETLNQLRKYNPKRAPTPLRPIPQVFAQNIHLQAGRSLKYGFGVRADSYSQDDVSKDRLYTLRNLAFSTNSEFGMSDRLVNLENHPDYKITVPLRLEPEEPEDDRVERRLTTDYRPLMPLFDEADETNRQPDIESNLETAIEIVNKNLPTPLTAKQENILRLLYGNDMSIDQISNILGVSYQAVSGMAIAVIKKIQSSPRAMKELQELAAL